MRAGAAAVEDIPPDEYVPSADDVRRRGRRRLRPVFDSGLTTWHRAEAGGSAASAPVDTRPLPPAIALDAIGFDGEWPALAARLPPRASRISSRSTAS
jgi:DNA polymerase-3 subunit gamma/tau